MKHSQHSTVPVVKVWVATKNNDEAMCAQWLVEKLSQSGGSPVILSPIADYNKAYIHLYGTGKVTKSHTELYTL